MNDRNWKPWDAKLVCLVLGVVTFGLFAPSLGHNFLDYDDQVYVTENSHVRAGLTWNGLKWAFLSSHASNWHPLTWLSHMLDCQLYGLHPAGHHLTNVLLHVANTLVLFVVLNRMTGALWRSTCVAALFGWHPLHVESVAWVAERKDVLSAFFWMLALLSYVRYVEESRVQSPRFKIFYGLTLLCFALGLMAKPMVVTLPFVLLLLDFWPLRRIPGFGAPTYGFLAKARVPISSSPVRLLLEKVPFFILAIAASALTLWAQERGHAVVSVRQLPFIDRCMHASLSYGHYLAVTVFAYDLAVFYPYPAVSHIVGVVGSGLLLFLLSFPFVRLGRSRGYLPVGWLWFLGTLVPVIGLVQVGEQAWADRYTYIPLIGLFIIIVWGGFELVGKQIAVRATVVVVGLALLAGTSIQLRTWRDTRTVFKHAARVTRGNYLADTLLGSLLAREGKLDDAMDLYAQALRSKPDYPQAHFFVGRALEARGNTNGAMAEYETTLNLDPNFEPAHLFLGMALAGEKKFQEASAHYEAVLKNNPESVIAHNNLAKLLQLQGSLDEAVAHYSIALRFDPNLAPAHNNLGVLLLQKDRLAEGTAELKEAVRLNPEDSESQFNLAQALSRQSQWSEAGKLLAELARATPNDPRVHYELGCALAHDEKTREAMSCYAHALLLQADFPEALNALSWILATDPHPEFRNGTEAVHMAQRACELTERKQALPLLTLAAAYAETGQYAQAAATAEQARNVAASARQDEIVSRCGEVLKMAASKTAYRQAPGNSAP